MAQPFNELLGEGPSFSNVINMHFPARLRNLGGNFKKELGSFCGLV